MSHRNETVSVKDFFELEADDPTRPGNDDEETMNQDHDEDENGNLSGFIVQDHESEVGSGSSDEDADRDKHTSAHSRSKKPKKSKGPSPKKLSSPSMDKYKRAYLREKERKQKRQQTLNNFKRQFVSTKPSRLANLIGSIAKPKSPKTKVPKSSSNLLPNKKHQTVSPPKIKEKNLLQKTQPVKKEAVVNDGKLIPHENNSGKKQILIDTSRGQIQREDEKNDAGEAEATE